MSEQDRLKYMAQPSSFTASGGNGGAGIAAFISFIAITFFLALNTLFFVLAIYNFYLIFEGVGSTANWVYGILCSFLTFFISRLRF